MGTPKFDPTQPFEVVEDSTPKFDPSQPYDVVEQNQPEAPQSVLPEGLAEGLDVAKKSAGTAVGTGAGYLAGEIASELMPNLPSIQQAVSPLTENLAYVGIGGRSTAPGVELLKERAKDISQMVDPIVSPRQIGRQVIDEGILGTLGLGTKEGNLKRATESLVESSKPTNELLQSLSGTIPKQDILRRTEQLIDVPNLDMAIPENKALAKEFEKRIPDFMGEYNALQAEEAKRQLQKSVNYGTDEGAAKAAISKAQAKATREAVENEAFLAGKLEEFRKLKGKSGNIGVAQEIIESSIKPDTNMSPSGLLGKAVDFAKSKAAGAGAVGIDALGKGADIALKKAPKVLGALAGGAIGLAAQAAEEGLDSAPTGASMDSPAAQEDYLLESGVRDPKKIEEAKRLYNFKQGLPNQGRMDEVPSAYDKPETKKYKEEVLKAKQRGEQFRPDYVTSLSDKESKLQSLQDLQAQFQSMKGSKGAEAISPILESAISGTPEEKAKAEFQINQNPWLRNKVNKS